MFTDYLEYSETSPSGLVWKVRPHPRSAKKAGDVAGSLDKVTGYYRISLKGKSYTVHRIVFFLLHGYMPKVVDHIDRNRANNTESNLRDADHCINGHNRTGRKGYTRHSSGVGFTVMVKRGTQRLNKYVKTEEEAQHYASEYSRELYGEDLSLLN